MVIERSLRWLGGALACLLIATIMRSVHAQPGAQAGEWRAYGGDKWNSKYSPLDQISKDNFGTLRIAWRWRSSDAFLSKAVPGGGDLWAPYNEIFDQLNQEDPNRWHDRQAPSITNLKATPLMVGGRLYLNTPISTVAALDARTGQTLWIYNPKSYESGTTTMSAEWNERGVAYWTDGQGDERILFGTGDGFLIAVNAKNGVPVESFGVHGRVDLMTGLPQAKRGAKDWQNKLQYSVQSPPIVVRNTVITPASISSYNMTMEQVPGWTRGWDAKTGKLKWTFHTIPQTGEVGNETWLNDAWAYTGKVSGWSIYSADEELGYVYIPLNTAAPDYYGGHRPGNNLFAETLLCLDAETGRRVWHYQFVHHGLWDYDLPAAPNLLDITINGQRVKAVTQVTKQSLIFTFDRVTGKPIWPIEERPVPKGDVPGEWYSPTQPFPSKPAPLQAMGLSTDELIDFTPELRQMALKALEGYRYGPFFEPPSVIVRGGSNKGTVHGPSGAGGGANWGGAAVDPATGILYVATRKSIGINSLRAPAPGEKTNLRFIEARSVSAPQMPTGLPLFKPPYSMMTAVNMNTGEHLWRVPLGNGDAFRSNPAVKGLNLPPLGGDSNVTGPVLTKTLLISALTRGGTSNNNGPRLVARDKTNGQELASVDLPGQAIGTPMTYLVGDKQYIALTVSAPSGSSVPELVAFALP